MSLRSFSDFLPRIRTRPYLKKGLKRVAIFTIAHRAIESLMGFKKDTIDKEISFGLRGSTLLIKCSNNYIAQEIRFYQDEIRKKINRNIGGFSIKEIKIKMREY